MRPLTIQLHTMLTNSQSTTQSTKPKALALSGGGLRAALFQQGGILALALRGELSGIEHVAAISGGALAALALRRAHAEIEEEWKKFRRTDINSIQWQLSVANRAELYIGRCAGRDIRSRAALSWRCITQLFLCASLGLTRCVADQINAVLGRKHPKTKLPFSLVIGVHDLSTSAPRSIVIHDGTDLGAVAAAAMSIPGVMESIVVEPGKGAVCDGGLDDKTAFRLLRASGATDGLVVLDASVKKVFDASKPVSANATLLAVLERTAEANRAEDACDADATLAWVSLRDALQSGLNLDTECLSYLQQTRTDLNYFTAIERMSLTAAGFILTLHSRGEDLPAILERLRTLQTSTVVNKGKEVLYPQAIQFEEVCNALLAIGAPAKNENCVRRVLSFIPIVGKLATPWSVAESLHLVLEKSRRSIFPNIGSFQSSFYLQAFMAVGMGLFVAIYGLAVLTLIALVPTLLFSQWLRLSELHYLMMMAAAWSVTAIAMATFSLRKSKLDKLPNIFQVALALISLPLVLPIFSTIKAAILVTQDGSGVWSLKYPQSFLGRIASIFDFRTPKYINSGRRIGGWIAQILLISLLFLNPFFFAKAWAERVYHLSHLGWIGEMFLKSPLQPLTLVVLALEKILEYFFQINRFLTETMGNLGRWILAKTR